MKTIYNPQREQWPALTKRPVQAFDDIEQLVKSIFTEVRSKGDTAVQKYTALFDDITPETIRVTPNEIKEVLDIVPEKLKVAIALAKDNIEKFHKAQKTEKIVIETMEGVLCWQIKKPIQSIGLYIPGGSAPLFSTVLMLTIPAQIAGCDEIVLCTPPDSAGKVNPAILYAAHLCGVTKIYKTGGIQAIAAMAFGTQSIPKVSKIFGPGNQYVTTAKQMATQFGIAIDMPAGPSELLVVADDTAVPAFVAADLLSQAEHGPDSQVVLVSASKQLLRNVEREIYVQIESLPRKVITHKAIRQARFIYLEDPVAISEFINQYAPEHLIVCCKDEEFYTQNIQNAGSVFIGNYSPESAGDYASGTNHTLPTNGFAKAYSGVNLDSFLKSITFQKITPAGIRNIGPAVEIMAEAEGLEAHRNAITVRLTYLKTK